MRWLTNLFRQKVPEGHLTIDDLKYSTYAIFENGGIRVDLAAYFSTPEGKQAIEDSVKNLRIHRPQPRRCCCGQGCRCRRIR